MVKNLGKLRRLLLAVFARGHADAANSANGAACVVDSS
jgi:hypothetical protein